MKIGIIGSGNMGRSLGLRWTGAGHEVFFGSRDPNKAKDLVSSGSATTQAGDFDAAAAFGDVILYTVRDVLPSSLLQEPRVLSGKVVIDCNNSDILGIDIPDPNHRSGIYFATQIPSIAERLAANAPEARVVKAFNTIPHKVIELSREKLAPHRISVFLCSDDPQAKSIVKGLAEDLGFVGIDSGELERARLVESVADFIRFQGLGMGLGPFVTMSMKLVNEGVVVLQ